MSASAFSGLLIITVCLCLAIAFKVDKECTFENTLKFTIEIEKNNDGDWIPTLSALKNLKDATDKMAVKFEHSGVDCSSSALHEITALIRDPKEDTKENRDLPQLDGKVVEKRATGYEEDQKDLLFSKRGGKNVKITKDRKTAYTPSDEWGYGAAITRRPLKNDELFEVKVGRGYIHIGVTTNPATQMHYSKYMQNQTVGAWTWNVVWRAIYHNEKKVKENYPKVVILAGDRVGVARKSDNSLHFYYNGADLGTAVRDVGYPVYGFVDLIHPNTRVTIVDEKNSHFP